MKLTDAQIIAIRKALPSNSRKPWEDSIRFARAIEHVLTSN